MRDSLKGVLGPGDYSFLGNPALCEGGWDGQTLTLWTANSFIRDMLDKPAVLTAVSRAAAGMMGTPVHVAVREGKAPPETAAVPAPAREEDALEAFLAGGQGNIIIE